MNTPPKAVEKHGWVKTLIVPFSLLVLTVFVTYILADVLSWRNPLNYATIAGSSVLFSMLATYFRRGMASGLPSIAAGFLLFVLSFWVLKLIGYSPQDVAFAVMTSPEDRAHVDAPILVEGTFGPSACDTRILAVAVMQLDPARYYCYRLACNGSHKWTSPLQIGRIDNLVPDSRHCLAGSVVAD
jgi:hypothetical protein